MQSQQLLEKKINPIIKHDENGVIDDNEINNISKHSINFQTDALECASKLDEIKNRIEELDVNIKVLKDYTEELKLKKEALEKRYDEQSAPLVENMLEMNIKKIKGEHKTLLLQFFKETVVIEEEKIVPSEFWRIVHKKEINKDLIYKSIKNGSIISGVHLEKNVRLCIK